MTRPGGVVYATLVTPNAMPVRSAVSSLLMSEAGLTEVRLASCCLRFDLSRFTFELQADPLFRPARLRGYPFAINCFWLDKRDRPHSHETPSRNPSRPALQQR